MRHMIKRMINALLKFFWVFPICSSKVFLLCLDGTMIGLDPKAFSDWCTAQDKNLEFVWGISKSAIKDDLKFKNGRLVHIKSIRGFYDLMTSRAVLYNVNVPSYIPFRKKQKLVNTWHGYPFKKVGIYISETAEADMNKATACISHSEEYTQFCLKESMRFHGEILTCGAPRNDIFFTGRALEVGEKIRKQYNVGNKKIALWMPTFRKSNEYHAGNIDFERLIQSLERRFGGDWMIFFRLHPAVKNKVKPDGCMFVDVSEHQDAQELLCCADVLISDYSSAMWDYSLSKKPVFAYVDDEAEYIQSRGLYKKMTDLPYMVAHDNEELEEQIKNYDEKSYHERLNQYFISTGCYEKGESAARIYEYIFRDDCRGIN